MTNHQVFKVPIPGENVCLSALPYGARVISNCSNKDALLSGNTTVYDANNGFTYHNIEIEPEGIIIQLGDYTYLNHLRMLLWDRDVRVYSYRIDVSTDMISNEQGHWDVVWDHASYQCHSWQDIWFRPRIVRFIRIVGKWNSVNDFMCVVALQAFLDLEGARENTRLDKWKLLAPTRNVASEACGARIIDGLIVGGQSLINPKNAAGNENIYTEHVPWLGAIVIRLAQPYIVSSIRLRLHRGKETEYRFLVDTSPDGGLWCRARREKISDKKNVWELIEFEPRPVSFIRLSGQGPLEREGRLRVSNLECPSQSKELN